MAQRGLDDLIYVTPEGRLSVRDLLDFFSKKGPLRVSDLHLRVGSPPVYRIDGDLEPMKTPPLDAATVEAIARRLLTDEELESLQARRSVDASYLTERMLFRLNAFHDSDGLALAVRALEPKPPPVEQVGFPNQVWRDILVRQQGLVLVTGITGAGKSTTIASLVTRIAQTRPCRIITLEDPIEYRLPSHRAIISQREVGRDVPDFERGLRDCLREDPDVIFVGEMRDRDSASWTLTAAETGHLVFSTLHTRDARGTITRILDLYPVDRQEEVASQLSLGLSHVISQRLVPRADGKGRCMAMEILQNTYAVANLIRVRKTEQLYSVIQTQTRDAPGERMITLERSLAELARAGHVTPNEAQKWANHPAVFVDEMKRLQAG